MKVKLNIICGMIGTGKTALINQYINTEELKNENILIIQMENGKSIIKRNNNITIAKVQSTEISKEKIIEYISENSYDRVIVETNIFKELKNTIEIFKDKDLKQYFIYEKIITIIDAKTYNTYLKNLGMYYINLVNVSEVIIIKNTKSVGKININKIKRELIQINNNINFIENIQSLPTSSFVYKFLIGILVCCILGFLVYDIRLILSSSDNINNIYKNIVNSFTSMFVETIPFIIIGAVFSGIIQLFISDETMYKLFSKNKLLGYIVALFGGIFLPICECGLAPIARGLISKGVNKSIVTSFLLAAPIVNPIAVMSTIIVFGKDSNIVVYRIIIGLLVAVVVGLLLNIDKNRLNLSGSTISCNCSLCNESNIKQGRGKISLIISFVTNEFFYISKYIVYGILFSSIVQAVTSLNIFNLGSYGILGEIIIIILFSVFFSVCSTSDAFIGGKLMSTISSSSITGFLVLGPVINIKSILLLGGSLGYRYTIKLIILSIICTIGFVLLFPFK